MSTLHKINLSEYDALIARGAFEGPERRRLELINGELREMSPAGLLHEDFISFLTEWSVQRKPENASIRVQCSIGIPEFDSAPEPDLAWVRKVRYTRQRPEPADVLLAIEVSHSSIKFDLGEKKGLYARAGVQEYWVVDVAKRRIVVFRQPVESQYTESLIFQVGETLAPVVAPTAVLDVGALFSEDTD